MTILLATVLGLLMGASLGILGAGGSIAAVPIFVYVLGAEPKAAIAMSLAVVGATAAIGAWTHGRAGNIRLNVAAIFAPVAMVGTYLGARLATFMSGETQLVLFAAVMLTAAFFMGRSDGVVHADARVTGGAVSPPSDASMTAGEEALRPVVGRSWAGILLGLEGFVVGILTGLVGVGGGFLIVPALVLMAAVPMREAVGTSLLIIAFKSAAGFVGYLDQVNVDWLAMGVFTLGAVAGIFGGTSIGHRLPVRVLRRSFAGFLVIMAIFILYMEGVG